MTVPLYIAAAILDAAVTLFLAWRYREVRKFLAGAFFVSSGMQFYFYLARIPVPLIGTNAVQSPELSAGRSAIHFVLFLICLYFGFFSPSRRKDS